MVSEEGPFYPYATMFKKVNRSRLQGFIWKKPHSVECVSCKIKMPMGTFLDSKDILEEECMSCHVTAAEYWGSRLHQEITDA